MKKFFKMLGYVIFYILIYYAIFKPIFFLWCNVLPNNPAISGWIKENPIGIIVFNDVIALPLFSIVVGYVKKQSILKVSLFRKTSLGSIIGSCIIGLGMGVFVIAFFSLPFSKKIPIFEELLAYLYNSSGILAFAGFVFIGTFFKEILFRGLIFNEMRKAIPLTLAIFFDALIYGALFFNFDPALTIFGTLGNIVIALVYVLTGSIWAPYIAQAMNNLCIYAFRHHYIESFPDNKLIIPLVISGLTICGVLLWMHFQGRKKVKQDSPNITLKG